MKRTFKDGDWIFNQRENYIGQVYGITRISKLFQGDTKVDFQYIIAKPAKVKRNPDGRIMPINALGSLQYSAEHELEPMTDPTAIRLHAGRPKKQWEEQSELHRAGYHLVDPGTHNPTPDHKRYTALINHIDNDPIKGKQAIAHICMLIDTRDLQSDREKVLPAMRKWISDLEWLSERYPIHSALIEQHLENYRQREII